MHFEETIEGTPPYEPTRKGCELKGATYVVYSRTRFFLSPDMPLYAPAQEEVLRERGLLKILVFETYKAVEFHLFALTLAEH